MLSLLLCAVAAQAPSPSLRVALEGPVFGAGGSSIDPDDDTTIMGHGVVSEGHVRETALTGDRSG